MWKVHFLQVTTEVQQWVQQAWGASDLGLNVALYASLALGTMRSPSSPGHTHYWHCCTCSSSPEYELELCNQASFLLAWMKGGEMRVELSEFCMDGMDHTFSSDPAHHKRFSTRDSSC